MPTRQICGVPDLDEAALAEAAVSFLPQPVSRSARRKSPISGAHTWEKVEEVKWGRRVKAWERTELTMGR